MESTCSIPKWLERKCKVGLDVHMVLIRACHIILILEVTYDLLRVSILKAHVLTVNGGPSITDHVSHSSRYRPDLEMKSDQAHNQALEILRQVIEYFEACWVFAVLNIDRRSKFPAGEGDVFITNLNFQLLSLFARWFFPMRIIDRRYFGLPNDAFDFFHNRGSQMDLAPYHFTPFVIRIVGIAQLSAGREFKFHEFVTKTSLVTHVISNIEVVVRGFD